MDPGGMLMDTKAQLRVKLASVYLGDVKDLWEVHRKACGGSHANFARHLLVLHTTYCTVFCGLKSAAKPNQDGSDDQQFQSLTKAVDADNALGSVTHGQTPDTAIQRLEPSPALRDLKSISQQIQTDSESPTACSSTSTVDGDTTATPTREKRALTSSLTTLPPVGESPSLRMIGALPLHEQVLPLPATVKQESLVDSSAIPHTSQRSTRKTCSASPTRMDSTDIDDADDRTALEYVPSQYNTQILQHDGFYYHTRYHSKKETPWTVLWHCTQRKR